MSVMEKAKTLAEEIASSSEYSDLKNAQKTMNSDDEAKSILDNYKSLQKRIQMVKANGKNVSAKQQKQLQAIKAKMKNNNKIKNFMEHQKRFNQLMQTVNQTISGHLQNINNTDKE